MKLCNTGADQLPLQQHACAWLRGSTRRLHSQSALSLGQTSCNIAGSHSCNMLQFPLLPNTSSSIAPAHRTAKHKLLSRPVPVRSPCTSSSRQLDFGRRPEQLAGSQIHVLQQQEITVLEVSMDMPEQLCRRAAPVISFAMLCNQLSHSKKIDVCSLSAWQLPGLGT